MSRRSEFSSDEDPIQCVGVFEARVAQGEVSHFGRVYFVSGGWVEDRALDEGVVEPAELSTIVSNVNVKQKWTAIRFELL